MNSVAQDIREMAERLAKIQEQGIEDQTTTIEVIEEGFMSVDHYQDSDGASDFAYSMDRELARVIMKEAKDQGNEYNTPGVWNVYALYKDGAFQWYEANDADGDVMKALKQIIPLGKKWEEDFRANSGR